MERFDSNVDEGNKKRRGPTVLVIKLKLKKARALLQYCMKDDDAEKSKIRLSCVTPFLFLLYVV